MTGHWRNLRRVGLGTVVFTLVVLLPFGMAYDRYEMLMLAGGIALFGGWAAFIATFVFGPLAYPRRSLEAALSWGLLAFSGSGLIVVGTAAARRMLA